MSRIFVVLLAATLAGASVVAGAADPPPEKGAAPAVFPMSSGEVKQIDKGAKRITLKHGPLLNLDMPGMTMTFRVKDATMLDRVKAGDKVSFIAERLDGEVTVTRLEPAR